jgi:hypothetical protein
MPKKIRQFSELMKSMLTIGRHLKLTSTETELTSFDYNGLDISDTSVTAGFPDIKDRFTPDWVEYFNERSDDFNPLSVFAQCCFHLGYQQGIDHESEKTDGLKRDVDFYRSTMKSSLKDMIDPDDLIEMLGNCWDASDDYREQLDRINGGTSNFDKPTYPTKEEWINKILKK